MEGCEEDGAGCTEGCWCVKGTTVEKPSLALVRVLSHAQDAARGPKLSIETLGEAKDDSEFPLADYFPQYRQTQ